MRMVAVLMVFLGHWGPAKGGDLPLAKRGVVFVADGIGGWDITSSAASLMLPHAGVPHEIRPFLWCHGWGKPFQDLQDLRYLLRKADELALEVRKVKAEDPDRPVFLVGRSGGTGLVVAAAEQLPPGTLERIILLSSAMSPNYNLRPALRATRGEFVSFYSPHDRVILGWGTSRFGSIDRVYGPSAGMCRFTVPSDLSPEDAALYARLVQVPWHAAMILEGHTGGHVGTSLPGFIRTEVAPWLKTMPAK